MSETAASATPERKPHQAREAAAAAQAALSPATGQDAEALKREQLRISQTKASPADFKTSAEFDSPQTFYCAPAGIPVPRLLESDYWAHLTQGNKVLRSGCRIVVTTKDDAYLAELYVRKVGRGFAQVVLLSEKRFDALDADKPDDEYEIRWISPYVRYRILRRKDGTVLKEGLATMQEAHTWIAEHRSAMRR